MRARPPNVPRDPPCPNVPTSTRSCSSAPGPIVIGQACEFDYSGTQACKALREEGYEVVLVNSNPATIMTDPEMADRTYIEPITCRGRRADHREGAARRPAADARRPDGPDGSVLISMRPARPAPLRAARRPAEVAQNHDAVRTRTYEVSPCG